MLIKSRKIIYVGHVANIGDRRGSYRGLVGELDIK